MNRQHAWHPEPVEISQVWVKPWRARATAIAGHVALALLRNLIPVVGLIFFAWSADDVVLLSAFNLGFVFTAWPLFRWFVLAGVPATTVRMLAWAVPAVLMTWCVVATVAYFVEVPRALEIVRHGFKMPDTTAVWSASCVSIAALIAFMQHLRRGNRQQDELQLGVRSELPGMRPLRATISMCTLALVLSMEAWAVYTLLMPLGTVDELAAPLAITIATAVSLFLDVFRIFGSLR